MNFYGGIKGKDYFPWDGVFDLDYLSTQVPNKWLTILAKENYGQNDSGSITHDLHVLADLDEHARGTNDFYNGGKMEYYMNKWMTLTNRILEDKQNLNVSDVVSNIVTYNDNLEKRKRQVCGYLLKNSCYDFNYAYHVKEEGYWEDYEYTSCGVTVSGSKWIPPVYYKITGFQSLKEDQVEQIAAIAEAMESESGIKFINPRDWRNKIKRTDS